MLALWLAACLSTPPVASRASVKASLSEIGWLSGHWQGEQAEELWMPPRAGTMLGTGRVVVDEQTVFHEYLRIVLNGDGTVRYWAAPEGATATPFDLVELGDGRAVFENASHDFPQRIVYEAVDGGLVTRVSRLDDEGEPTAMARVP